MHQKTVSFTRLDDATPEELQFANDCFNQHLKGLTQRIIRTLMSLQGETMGTQVDRLEHSLQTATRALRDGADEETIACALLHDIGDDLAPGNHGEVAAAILRPYVSPENAWMLEHHEVFQGYHYYHLIGRDRHEREKFRGHPAFERTRLFCEQWDRVSFDPDYDTLPLSTFEPILERIFSQKIAWIE
jgi:predicted HD phosphohydrolase